MAVFSFSESLSLETEKEWKKTEKGKATTCQVQGLLKIPQQQQAGLGWPLVQVSQWLS